MGILRLFSMMRFVSPPTGDDSRPLLYGVVAGIAIVAAIVIIVISRRRSDDSDEGDE